MTEISGWVQQFLAALDDTFGARVWFAGLQGSLARGEGTADSDIDMVVILETLSPGDIGRYGQMLDTLPHRERICGFLSGREELLNWDPADLFQFYHDTTPIRGSLAELELRLDVDRAIKMGVCAIYHGCVHNMLHGQSGEVLRELYKAASFAVRAICFRQTGRYVRRQAELRKYLAPAEREIVNCFMKIKMGEEVDFDGMSETLFHWAQGWIHRMGA